MAHKVKPNRSIGEPHTGSPFRSAHSQRGLGWRGGGCAWPLLFPEKSPGLCQNGDPGREYEWRLGFHCLHCRLDQRGLSWSRGYTSGLDHEHRAIGISGRACREHGGKEGGGEPMIPDFPILRFSGFSLLSFSIESRLPCDFACPNRERGSHKLGQEDRISHHLPPSRPPTCPSTLARRKVVPLRRRISTVLSTVASAKVEASAEAAVIRPPFSLPFPPHLSIFISDFSPQRISPLLILKHLRFRSVGNESPG